MSEGTGEAAGALARGFLMLVVLTTGLIVLGALVRAHDAGLACPDWPQCFGAWIPRFDLQVAFEWTHRLVAGSVAILFALLAVATFRFLRANPAPVSSRIVALLGLGAGLLLIQILLGALTVWLKLASWTVTAHLLTGNAFNATVFATAATLRADPAAPARTMLRPGIRWAAVALALLLLVQLLLGGQVSSRYAGLACPEWPTCNGGNYFPSGRGAVGLHLAHRMVGYLFLTATIAATWYARNEASLTRAFTILALLALVQVGLGISNVLWALPVELTALHSALAAMLVLVSTAILLATRQRS